jgi:circadian clock protein KaiB
MGEGRSDSGEWTDNARERPILSLCLFTVDETSGSMRARRQLERLQQQLGRGELEIEVIDVLERPDLAEEEEVLATPALIRFRPLPRRKIVGDLSDWETVVVSLNLPDLAAQAASSGGRSGASQSGRPRDAAT